MAAGDRLDTYGLDRVLHAVHARRRCQEPDHCAYPTEAKDEDDDESITGGQ